MPELPNGTLRLRWNPELSNIAVLTMVVTLLLDQVTRSAGRTPEAVTMTEDFQAYSKNLSANPSTGKLSITPRKLTFSYDPKFLRS